MRDAIFYKAYKALATDLKRFFDHEGSNVLAKVLSHGLLGLVGASSTDPSSRVRFLGEYLARLPLRSEQENRINLITMVEEKRQQGKRIYGVADKKFNHLHVERPASLGIGPLSDRNIATVPLTSQEVMVILS